MVGAILELDAAPDPLAQLAVAKRFVETTLAPIYS
jgi:hypothetical protein